jgi:Xaa-Pro aminopeptidase
VNEADLLLLDAGVEMNSLYTADVTRTFPVSGEFSGPQRQVYDLVHASHVAALAEVRPGNDYSAFHHTAMRVLAEGLHDWGLLPVSVDKALDPSGQHHRRYIVCGTGHFLGLDVHDCADARQEAYQQGILERGMALTVEPGLYFHPNDETLPPELRGIGVRIEDDLVVTSTGADILSDALPIEADDVAAWVRKQRS